MDFKGLFSHKFVVRVVEKEQDDAADLVALKNQMSALSNQKKSRTWVFSGFLAACS